MTNLKWLLLSVFSYLVLSTGVGLITYSLTSDWWVDFCNRKLDAHCFDNFKNTGLNLGIVLAVIGGICAFSSSFVLGRGLMAKPLPNLPPHSIVYEQSDSKFPNISPVQQENIELANLHKQLRVITERLNQIDEGQSLLRESTSSEIVKSHPLSS